MIKVIELIVNTLVFLFHLMVITSSLFGGKHESVDLPKGQTYQIEIIVRDDYKIRNTVLALARGHVKNG